MIISSKWKAFFRQTILAMFAAVSFAPLGASQQVSSEHLSFSVDPQRGTYQVAMPHGETILTARVAAQIDNRWLRSSDYRHCEGSVTPYQDSLGAGRQVTVACSGLTDQPTLEYVVQVYDQHPYGALQVRVRNTTQKQLTLQAIRAIEAIGPKVLNLGGDSFADRVLSDSFSEDWPEMKIYDLTSTPGNIHRGAGSQLIYNRESKQSFFVGALSSEQFLTILRLQVEGTGRDAKIASYAVDSTGTTEIQKQFDYALKNAPKEDQVELSLSLPPGREIASERLLVAAGANYREHLSAYGEAIRLLQHARVDAETPIGWWSWTAFYGGINEAETLANADWQAQHLKSLGYKFLQIDEGYQYARGEFTTANATQFPSGMAAVGRHITGDGLTFGIWTAPFEVSSRAWVYEHHKDWLVHTAKGDPIPIGKVWNQDTDVLYALDTTHPGAQEYLRQTYRTLTREWGVRFIKLDFMDTAAIEGYRYRADTTALVAQRIGLQIIRDTVGNDVILDKDGSPMLNVVGLVDTGRVSQDTAHNFQATKAAATGIAARFYMHRNFFLSDPDAFNTTSQVLSEAREPRPPVSLDEAEASIALSAVSGGMYEIGDDMLVLGSEQDRLALVENQELLNMAKLGKTATPIDLMTYEPEDLQPSVFFLRESPRQAILTVFNWTEQPRSHAFELAALGLPADHAYSARNLFDKNAAVALEGNTLRVPNQPPHSVKMILLLDTTIPAAIPNLDVQAPSTVKVGEPFPLSVQLEPGSFSVIGYHWDFGDGTSADGAKATHVYTRAAKFSVQLRIDGVEGVPAERSFSIEASGSLRAHPNLSDNRRFEEPSDQ